MTLPAIPICPTLAPDPARIVTPRKHGQILIEPPPVRLHAVLAEAQQRAAGKQCAAPACGAESRDELGGLSRVEISRQARADLAAAMGQFARQIGAAQPPADILAKPWVITGHQVEFYHAGVWAKAVAVDAVARQTGAVPVDLLVDHDGVEQLGFAVPAHEDGHWTRRTVEWAAAPVYAADGLLPPTPEQFARWRADLCRYPLARSDSLQLLLNAVKPGTGAPGESYTAWMSRGRKALGAALDVDVLHVPTSLLCGHTAWLAFVLAWVRHAAAWGQIYNAQVQAYRRRAGIKNAAHPMPDLKMGSTQIEMPFWIYRVGTPRERLVLQITDGVPALLYQQQVLGLGDVIGAHGWEAATALGQLLERAGLVIRPRALSLTMFVRLFLADLFIHGIGGALYDQITDGILSTIFGTAPPYACVSAAWLLPLGQPQETSCVSSLRHQRHHLLHNPQLAMAERPAAALLLQERAAVLAQLGAAPHGHDLRRTLFRHLHQINSDLWAREPWPLARLERHIASALEHDQVNKVLLWREWFFGLHSLESLRDLVQRVRE